MKTTLHLFLENKLTLNNRNHLKLIILRTGETFRH